MRPSRCTKWMRFASAPESWISLNVSGSVVATVVTAIGLLRRLLLSRRVA